MVLMSIRELAFQLESALRILLSGSCLTVRTIMTDNLPVPDDAPWLNLSPEEVEKLRNQKQELTEYGKQKIKQLNAQRQSRKIMEATMPYTLRPKNGDRQRVIVAAFRELIYQCGYKKDELLVVNIRDILGIIEVLENE